MDIQQKAVTEDMAAVILSRFMGGNAPKWIRFLIEDRAYDNDLPFLDEPDGIYYHESDLFEFIACHNPTSLGFNKNDGSGSVDGSTFQLKAQICVDYAHAGKLVIEIEPPRASYGNPWISPKAARQLAVKLNQLADECDSHEFNFEGWVVARPGEKIVSRITKNRTGDRELDRLLLELGYDEPVDETSKGEVMA